MLAGIGKPYSALRKEILRGRVALQRRTVCAINKSILREIDDGAAGADLPHDPSGVAVLQNDIADQQIAMLCHVLVGPHDGETPRHVFHPGRVEAPVKSAGQIKTPLRGMIL